MNTRDAINEMLLALNELPLEIEDAVEDVPIAIIVNAQLEITKKKILSKGWWFNTIAMELVPNTEKYIIVPQTFLSIEGVSNSNVAVRDWKLFDKAELSYKFDDSVECNVIEDISFDDIPFVVYNYIVQSATLTSYINIIGNTDDIALRREEKNEARIEAIREDSIKSKGNVLSDAYTITTLDRASK
jgi:hypothetical protein